MTGTLARGMAASTSRATFRHTGGASNSMHSELNAMVTWSVGQVQPEPSAQ